MRHRIRFFVVGMSLITLTGTSGAQWPPERTKNLKVLPADIPIRSLVDTMAKFTRALGVRCTYCHVGEEGQPLGTYDFAADEKPTKTKARVMLQMVMAINSEHLAKLSDRREPRITVNCVTCHHGIAEPRPLQEVLLAAYDAGGVDSVDAKYRALRQRYYGSAAYDFGEVPLADVASAVAARQGLRDAVRLSALNIEFSPTSAFALRQAAAAQLAVGDTASAIASYQRALTINANDAQSRRALETLGKKPPR